MGVVPLSHELPRDLANPRLKSLNTLQGFPQIVGKAKLVTHSATVLNQHGPLFRGCKQIEVTAMSSFCAEVLCISIR